MKKLLLVLILLVSAQAQAGSEWVSFDLANGTHVVMVNKKDACEGALRLLTMTGTNGKTYAGCFLVVGEQIVVRWPDGELNTFYNKNMHNIKSGGADK